MSVSASKTPAETDNIAKYNQFMSGQGSSTA